MATAATVAAPSALPAAPAAAAASSYTSYKLEIDRTRALKEMPLARLLKGNEEGVAVVVPQINVAVKKHVLSVPSSDPEEAKYYSDHTYPAFEMTLERLRDHYWFPEYGFLVNAQGKVWRHSILGRYADPDCLTTGVVEKSAGELLFHEFLLHGCPSISEPVAITSHYASHNYGHFMLDMAPLIHKLSGTGLQLISRPLLAWHGPIYRRLGYDPQAVRTVRDRAVFLRDVIISSRHNATGTHAASPQIRETFEAVLAHIRADMSGARSNRIFVSRGAALNREMRNRLQLAEALARRGFTTVRPERLSFDEQAVTFAEADIVVSEFGAAMANVVFCKPRTKVIEIIPEQQNDPWSARLCAALDLEHVTLFHRVNDVDRLPIEIGGKISKNICIRYDADIESICRAVDALTESCSRGG